MADTALRRYIFASDFDQTLTFNDSGYVLSELLGISTEEFERKAQGMASFADVLSKDDAAAIHAYLNARISEDWGEMSISKK